MNTKFLRTALVGAAMTVGMCASAQYYEIANQLPSLISPILQGGVNYKGFVELSGTAGIGDSRANFVGISTSQGFRYADWFFMGVGIGVDVAIARDQDRSQIQPRDYGYNDYPGYWDHSYSKTKCMIPVFTDFRFNIGGMQNTSCFIDLKVGAAWLIGNSYLGLSNGACLNTDTQFYLKPTVGVRIPVNKQNPNQAFNIGVTYQLLTSNNNYYWYDNGVTLSNIGVTVGYEW